MTHEDVLCKGRTVEGNPCTRHRSLGSEMCRWHSPESIEERAQALEAQAAAIRATA